MWNELDIEWIGIELRLKMIKFKEAVKLSTGYISKGDIPLKELCQIINQKSF